MTLRVHLPPGLEAERRHAVGVVLGEWLGLDHTCSVGDGRETVIDDGGERSLAVADVFFVGAASSWLETASVPEPPLMELAAAELPPGYRPLHPRLPVLFGSGAGWSNEGNSARVGVDVFGAVFFLITGYHEAVSNATDAHGRFPLQASLLHRAGLLGRPLANEYAEALRAALLAVFPGATATQHEFRVVSTHDVDRPFRFLYCTGADLPRALASEVREQRSPMAALEGVRDWRRVQRDGVSADPTNNFDAVMSADENAGAESAYYFIPDPDPVGRVPRQAYAIDDPAIRAVMTAIDRRGHEVGLHPGYAAHGDQARLKREAGQLREAMIAAPVGGRLRGGRQHFLRWNSRTSPRAWDAIGMEYDSSIAHAEEAGFRTGSCLPFPMFDLEQHRALSVRERPLLLMDVSLTDAAYMNLTVNSAEARQRIDAIRAACRHFGGEFVILWHNDVLARPGQWDLYTHALGGGSAA